MDWFFEHGNAGTVGLLFFFTVFVGVAIWAYRPSLKEKIEANKNIPFKGE